MRKRYERMGMRFKRVAGHVKREGIEEKNGGEREGGYSRGK